MKELAKYADYLFALSLLGLLLAAYGSFADSDIWLASSQWAMVSIGMVVYALYLKTAK